MRQISKLAFVGAAISLSLLGCSQEPSGPSQTVGMRRLTEAQYRNSIADIFGPEIVVAGRFEPIIRPVQQLIATGASEAAISPAGLEQFDAIARGVATQVMGDGNRDAFVKCAPADAAKADDKCAEATLAPIGRYVFRRPLSTEEKALYVQMANAAAGNTGSFYKGLELSLAAMLMSPNFLYVVEKAEPDPSAEGMLRLDNYSRASRLSFLLWDTTPNEALLAAAEKGELTSQRRLESTASRMIASKRLEQGIRAFFSDMLLYEKFEEVSKDPIIYPRFNGEVAKALPEQMLRTITGHLIDKSGDYRQLFTTKSTFINRSLGPIYNVPVRTASGWEPLELAANSERAGLVGQAGFLALYSTPGRSQPTVRGRAIRETLLCQPVPDPPGDVDFKLVVEVDNPVLKTARQRLKVHDDQNQVCAGCHKLTDPVGLTLEKFDGIGAYRTKENDTMIDVSGNYLDGVAYEGVVGLGERLASDTAATECVANRAFEYATGRKLEQAMVAEDVKKAFAADGYKIQSLFQRVATAPALYQVPKPAESPQQAAMSTTN